MSLLKLQLMNVKSILIGAIVTLIVTILGGLIVYYVTANPNKEEKLTYWFDRPSTFSNDSSSIVIQTIYFTNDGNEPASDISLSVEYPNYIAIIDKNVSFSSGKSFDYRDSVSNKTDYTLKARTLFPKEVGKVSFLIKGEEHEGPAINIKSTKSMGVEVKVNDSEEKPMFDKIFQYVLFVIFFFQILIIVAFLIFRRKIKSEPNPSSQSVNNTAFLLLHKNLYDLATKALEATFYKKGADSFIFGNYAVCIAIKGDFDVSLKLIEASYFYSYTNHEKCVALFNYGLILILKGDYNESQIKLQEAINLNQEEIEKYIAFSDFIKQLRTNSAVDTVFSDLVYK